MRLGPVLSHHRPDRAYKTKDEKREAEERVDAAYKTLDANPDAACAAGAALVRTTKDDWERIMIATTIKLIGADKGEPFLLWALAKATTVDSTFEPVIGIACELASRQRPEYLPAIFSVLRAHDAHIYLPLHSWYIPANECLFYVFVRYGREVIPYLYPMLGHVDPYVRRNAAMMLGFFMDKRAQPVFLEMLKADDVGSSGAAFALGQLGDEAAIAPITQLLKSPEARSRFSAAYALFEIGSKTSLPALEAALSREKEESLRQEMTSAIEHIRMLSKPQPEGRPKLRDGELQKALDEAERANGLDGDIEAIAASAGPDQLKQLEVIRLGSTTVMSDRGNKRFRRWTEVIKTIQERRMDWKPRRGPRSGLTSSRRSCKRRASERALY